MAERSLVFLVTAHLASHANPPVNTRCIFYRIQPNLSDPDNFTLCPILDFANHSHGKTYIFPVIDSEIWEFVAKKTPKQKIMKAGSVRQVLSKSGRDVAGGGRRRRITAREMRSVPRAMKPMMRVV